MWTSAVLVPIRALVAAARLLHSLVAGVPVSSPEIATAVEEAA